MAVETTFWSLLAGKLAGALVDDLLAALGRPIRRKLGTPKVDRALRRSARIALERALEGTPTPRRLEGFGEEGRKHFESLLRDFLGREEVVDQLSNVLDPRPDTVLDFAAVVGAMVSLTVDTITCHELVAGSLSRALQSLLSLVNGDLEKLRHHGPDLFVDLGWTSGAAHWGRDAMHFEATSSR